MNEEIFCNNNLVAPFEEIVSFETLWAQNGMTEKKMTELFMNANNRPSQVLDYKKNFFEDVDDLKKTVERFISEKIGDFNVCLRGDFQYPETLRKALHPIELFYYKGNLDLLSNRSVSIVGARKASNEGLSRAKRLARELVENKFSIVSGLAEGVDTEAHKAAIDAGGITIGVIGTPIDKYYPKQNKSLQDYISKQFLLISQVPFYRYEHESFASHKYYFPRRNVTMAAISEATIIVEASDTSGSLTQARACIQQGKKLFILDSCFKNSNITWPKNYEKKGAIRVKNTKEILNNLIVQEI